MSEELKQTLKVVGGNPKAEELAAVLAILEAAYAEQSVEAKSRAKKPASSWNRNAGILRGNLAPGAGQWLASYRPGLE